MSSRYESYGRMDTQFQTDGDFHFTGIDMKHDRSALGSGVLAKSINKRLRTGVAETRPGTRVYQDHHFGNGIQGSAVFNNPNGKEQLLVAENDHSYVWLLEDGVAPKQIWIRVAGGDPIEESVWLVQAFDKMLLLRAGHIPLVWDPALGNGDIPPGYAGGFREIVKSDPADTSTVIIPIFAGYGISFQNRMLYLIGKDTIIMSDVLDYTSYDPVLASFRINAGESDQITCIHPYGKESIVIFKRNSVHQLSNFPTDPALAQQQVLSDELGAVAREAAVQVGGDIVFMSRAGLYR